MAADELGEIAVIAGSPYDAGLGVDLLLAEGIIAVPYATASSPDEQDMMQDQHADSLNSSFQKLLSDLHRRRASLAMLFCNSLSSVVDHEDPKIPIISPLTMYGEVLPYLRSSLVVAGNAHALLGVERAARRTSPGHRMLGVTDPALVRGIEYGDPETAFASSQMPTTLRYAADLGLGAVILACTHFAAIKSSIAATCDLPIIDVGSILVDRTVSTIRNRTRT